MHVLADIPIACTQVEPPVIVGIRWTAIVLTSFLNTTRNIFFLVIHFLFALKECVSENLEFIHFKVDLKMRVHTGYSISLLLPQRQVIKCWTQGHS